MKTKVELRLSHGMPEEFERAVWEAYSQLFITMEEATTAIQKYREEYAVASEEKEAQIGNDHRVTV